MAHEEGKFPDLLKAARVIPIYKGKNDPNCFENYRPISALNCLSKIMEKFLNTRLWDYLSKYKIVTTKQHGFRAGRSTESAAASFVGFVNKNIDSGRLVAGLFFDLSRAFDTLDIEFMRDKLSAVGIRGNTVTC
jgi:hypothetical protein